jgi:16S rRNA A1518/A1519 N6-dimethyltransferase RsmA/KsgA/DIM1 with predicted DNA glycosylase/AP lyase activity
MAVLEDPEGHEVAALFSSPASIRSRRVLEIGCGNGRLTKRYAGMAGSIIAIDPDAGAVAQLARTIPNVDARPLGIRQLDLTPHSVDVVLFAWSL